MSQHVAPFAVGLLLLAVGGVALAFGAAWIARRCGANPFAVGLIAAGLGTAAAALAFDLTAISRDRMRLAVGNIVGVNVAHITLALGLAALVRPLAGASRIVAAGIPVLIAATLVFWFAGRENAISPAGAGALLVAIVLAIAYLERIAEAEPATVRAQFAAGTPGPLWLGALLAVAALAALVGGAMLAVPAAEQLGRGLRGGTLSLGTTATAFATSLPGLVLAVIAARRGKPDAALATVLAACLFNVLFVAGVCGLLSPLMSREGNLQVSNRAIMNEIPALAISTLLLLSVLFNGLDVPRWQGAIFLTAYAAFVTWQMMAR